MTTGNTDVTASAAVDNIIITAAVPEPGTLVLAAVGLVGGLLVVARPMKLPPVIDRGLNRG